MEVVIGSFASGCLLLNSSRLIDLSKTDESCTFAPKTPSLSRCTPRSSLSLNEKVLSMLSAFVLQEAEPESLYQQSFSLYGMPQNAKSAIRYVGQMQLLWKESDSNSILVIITKHGEPGNQSIKYKPGAAANS